MGDFFPLKFSCKMLHIYTLQVICCEGNAGFYEIGAMGTPIDLGYSVLGWNHPGFAGSTVSYVINLLKVQVLKCHSVL